jgi:hypothetical protein
MQYTALANGQPQWTTTVTTKQEYETVLLLCNTNAEYYGEKWEVQPGHAANTEHKPVEWLEVEMDGFTAMDADQY